MSPNQHKVTLDPKKPSTSGAPFSVGTGHHGAAVQEYGCSKCRYSPAGCVRCRNPTFRPRTLAPSSEMRAVVAEQRRQADRKKQAVRKEQRKQDHLKTSSTARESLLQRLRTQIGPSEEISQKDQQVQTHVADVAPPRAKRPVNKKIARNAGDAELPTPHEQPPAKYRRITREAHDVDSNGGPPLSSVPVAIPEIQDEEMVDAAEEVEGEEEKTTPTKQHGVAAATTDTTVDVSERQNNKNKRPFLEMLTDTMDKSREARRASLGGGNGGVSGSSEGRGGLITKGEQPTPPLAELIDGPAIKRRKKAAEIEKLSPSKGGFNSPRVATWEPPVSPYGLLEEELYDNPWKLLLACLLLNKTSATQVRNVIWNLFQLIPTPHAAAAIEDTSEIEKIIQPLGLFRKRAVAIKKMSIDYLEKQWRDPKELFNLGQYAADAYFIFCRGMWKGVNPEDKDLKRYKEWLESTGGLGSGLTRHISGSGV